MLKASSGLVFCIQSVRWCSCFADKTTEDLEVEKFCQGPTTCQVVMGLYHQSAFSKVPGSHFPTEN